MNLKGRIKKANEVIDYAIDHKISVKKACVLCGLGDTYVKNLKATVGDAYNDHLIDYETYCSFFDKVDKYLDTKIYNELHKEKSVNINENAVNLKNKQPQEQIKYTVAGDTAELEWNYGDNYGPDHIKTVDELLEAADVDTEIWKVKDFIVNKWDVTAVVNKLPRTIQNFQVKARLEKQIDVLNFKNAAEIFVDMVKNYKAPVLNLNFDRNYLREQNLLEINIADLHFGKMCWILETGENYDTKIASKRFLGAIEKLLTRAGGFSYEKILFVIGNDFFNSDTILNTTTAGTPQDEDLRWQKTFRKGVQLVVDGISILKQTGVPVDVMVIAGNHDYERSFYLGEFLSAWFRNDEQVTIDNSPALRKYYRYFSVLLGFSHGSEEKEGSLPMIMANDIDSKKHWSETKFHEFHIGHWHHKKSTTYKNVELNEDQGVTVRVMSSLCGTDSWHKSKGFTSSLKAADAFVWNYNSGLVAHLNINIDIVE